MPTSHCEVKLYPWHVFCISHYKIALAETQERLKCSGEANQAASEWQQSKRDFKQLPLLRVTKKHNKKKNSPQFGNQSSVSYQEEDDRGGRRNREKKKKAVLLFFSNFHGDLTQEWKHTLTKHVDLKGIHNYCIDIISTCKNVPAIMQQHPFVFFLSLDM